MIDWNEVDYPGTSVFDGMTAAANWNTRALANVDAVKPAVEQPNRDEEAVEPISINYKKK